MNLSGGVSEKNILIRLLSVFSGISGFHCIYASLFSFCILSSTELNNLNEVSMVAMSESSAAWVIPKHFLRGVNFLFYCSSVYTIHLFPLLFLTHSHSHWKVHRWIDEGFQGINTLSRN